MPGGTLSPETPDTDTTDYIIAPLDVMLNYHARAVAVSREVPIRERVEFIRILDEKERSAWVSDFRRSSLEFGKVVKNVLLRSYRTYHMTTPTAPDQSLMLGAPRTPDRHSAPVRAPTQSPPGKGSGKGGAAQT